MPNQPSLVEALPTLLFQVGEQQRWIQDSPVLPNVWKAFAERPGQRVDLLITPHRGVRPAQLAERIRSAVGAGTGAGTAHDDPAVAFNQSMAVATLTFDELIADRKYQFVYIFAPVPLKGATGSAGTPLAVT